MRLEVRVKSKVRIGLGFRVKVKVKVLPGVRAEARSTQCGKVWQVPRISHQGMLPPGWGPRLSHGGSESLEKEEGVTGPSGPQVTHTMPIAPLTLLWSVTTLTHTHLLSW